jgi:hypothetical protein
MKLEVAPCGGGTHYYITVSNQGLINGLALKLTKSGTPFNGTDCWEIINNNTTHAIDYYDVVVNQVSPSCDSCLPPTTTTTTSTTQGTTTSTTTQSPKFRYLLYNVDTNTCLTTGSPLPVWSYLNISAGFYKIDEDPTLYYIQTSSHTDETFQFVTAAPSSCNTTTTTTTTQPPITYDYYTAEYYDCVDCGAGPVGTLLVAFNSLESAPIINRFYQPIGGPDGLAYKVIDVAGEGSPAYILTTTFGASTTCSVACSL